MTPPTATPPATATEPAPTEPDSIRRLGPRPLPLHVMTAAWTCLTSFGGYPLLKQGLLPLKAELQDEAEALRAELAKVAPAKFASALTEESCRLLDQLAAGVLAYRRHPYRRNLDTPPTVWREGTTRLLDYAPENRDGLPVLLVPSLINRAYVLDLSENRSLARWLAAEGFRPLLVDWDRPGEVERSFTLTDYIGGRLEQALDAALALTGRKPALLGYCMGGLLAVALAQRRQRDLQGMILLATPWDFHAGARFRFDRIMPMLAPGLAAAMEAWRELPTDVLQMLFYSLDPYLVIRKFRQFAAMDPASPKAQAFVALEDWLNDGIPLAGPVARECLVGWYGENQPERKRWRIAGRPVDPGQIDLSTLILVPARDRIVPPPSATPLLTAIPGALAMSPPLGHIGMVVAEAAPQRAWRPMAEFLGGLDRRDRPNPARWTQPRPAGMNHSMRGNAESRFRGKTKET
ncbi:MAG: alpha/beta hydrolase [Rhodospirillales bacterium]|nr:alpha/beta hydrolase [Rhodospirillales bacterium]